MRGFNLSDWAVRHPALMLFLVLALAAGGAMSYLRLGRAEDPSFTIKIAVVTASWPGATPREMAEQLVEPVEKKLHELPWYDSIQTYTTAGFAALLVSFKDNTPAREVPQLFYQLRKKLSDLRPLLPPGVNGPHVNDEFGDVDSVLYAVTAPGADAFQLKQVADGLRRRLEAVADVEKVTTYGVQPQRVYVEFSHAKLATLGLTARQIFDTLARQNDLVPTGIVETDAQRVPLRVSYALESARAIADFPIAGEGRVFRLGDVATISRGFADPPDYLVRQDGSPTVLVGVVMQQGRNILALGERLEAAVAAYRAEVPVGFEITRIADQPRVVQAAVGEFMRAFAEALIIVLGVSFLALGWRVGIVVALAVPLVLAIVFMTMEALGMALHRITLGALIIALGLLVDDAIIAVEMMVVKMQQGYARARAAAFAWTSTAFPMLTGTLVTAIGFMPIGFANSSVGEYAGGIFWVVAIALIASWFVAVIFTPYLGTLLLPEGGGAHAAAHDIYDTRAYRLLRRVVTWCVRRRVTVVLLTLAVLFAGIAGFSRVPQQFFPLSERPELFLDIRMPGGTAIGATDRVARRAEALLKGDADIALATTHVGAGSPRFWLGLSPQLPDSAFAQIVIVAKDLAARERIKARLERAIADGALAEARVRVDRFNFGPPVGFAVQFRVTGPEEREVRAIAERVRAVMAEDPNLIDPHVDWNERAPVLRLTVDQDRARALDILPSEIALSLQTLLNGVTATTLRIGTERVDVVARAHADERMDLTRIGELTITTRGGVAVPVAQLARISTESEAPILWRRNRAQIMTVRADVRDGVQAPDASNATWARLAEIRASLKPGYAIEVGGAIEASAKANASIYALFPAMLLGMLGFLMLQLHSFPRLFLVMMTAPLGIIGASLALNLSGRPFGFVALLGLIALAGMIMRNTVILVDQVEQDVSSGTHPRGRAIVEATVRRARPVILTAAAAILAMIPLSQSAFWGPMAYVIMGGLFAATFLTLLFLPALYALWFRNHLGERAPAAAAPTPMPASGPRPLATP
jgi:multidrug efflux pump subunit AcrB